MNIYQKINEVMKSVTYVKKDARVLSYKAITHDQVTAVLRSTMVKIGIVVNQSLLESKFEDSGATTNSGTKIMLYTAIYDIKFIDIDKPGDFVSVKVESQALDHGDKASGKAQSYALKYAMLKTFSLETGESDEGRQGELDQKREDKEPLDPEMIKEINSLIYETETETGKFLSFFKVSSVNNLLPSQASQAIKLLKTKTNAN